MNNLYIIPKSITHCNISYSLTSKLTQLRLQNFGTTNQIGIIGMKRKLGKNDQVMKDNLWELMNFEDALTITKFPFFFVYE